MFFEKASKGKGGLLPDDCLIYLLLYLPLNELAKISLIDFQHYYASNNDFYWQQKYTLHFETRQLRSSHLNIYLKKRWSYLFKHFKMWKEKIYIMKHNILKLNLVGFIFQDIKKYTKSHNKNLRTFMNVGLMITCIVYHALR